MNFIYRLLTWLPIRLQLQLAKLWLRFDSEAACTAWVQGLAQLDIALSEQLKENRELESELRSSADAWATELDSKPATNAALNSLVRTDSFADARPIPKRNPAAWAVVATVILSCGIAYQVWNRGDERDVAVSPDSGKTSEVSDSNMRTLLAAAQASQTVYNRVSDATQRLASQKLPEVSAKIGLRSEDFESTWNQAGSVSSRVAESFSKMLTLLDNDSATDPNLE